MSTESRRTKRHVGWGREAEKAFVSAMLSPSRDYDVDRNLQARNEYLLLNPRRSVPTIKIGDEVIVGFSAQAVDRALDSAARKRLY